MHGEYKTVVGKLVIVDFDVAAGHLCNVMVSGDFFLYPDSALGSLSGSIEGLDASLDESEFAERIRAGFEPGAELVGTSAEGIAIALRRGLDAG